MNRQSNDTICIYLKQLLLLLVCTHVYLLRAQTGGPNWQSIGPTFAPGGEAGMGSIRCIEYHPQNNAIAWIGTPGSGLWQTSNHGASWVTYTDAAPFKGVSSIVVDYSNPNRLFVATGDNQDGGMHTINGILGPYSKCIGVYTSSDGGLTFSAAGLNAPPMNPERIYKLIQDPITPNILFAATSQGIYRSLNYGALWQLAQAGNFSDITFSPTDSAYWYAAGVQLSGGASFWFSSDHGLSWTQNQFFAPVSRIAIAVIPANGDVHLLCSSASNQGFHGLYRSNRPDSSNTFQPYLSTPNILGWNTNGSGSGGMGNQCLSFTADPNDSTYLYVGSVNIWRVHLTQLTLTCMSSHVGGTQNPGSLSVVHAGQHALQFAPGTPVKLMACNDGGLYQSSNQAFSWQEVTHTGNGPVISQVLRIASHDAWDTHMIAGLYNNGTRIRNGSTWRHAMNGSGMSAQIDPADTAWCYITSPGGPIFRSANGGSSFTSNIYSNIPGSPVGASISPFMIHPHRQNQIIAGLNTIYFSDDRGNSWLSASPILSNTLPLQALYMPEADTMVFYVCTFTHLYRTSDKGQTWSDITPGGLSANITDISGNPEDPAKVWLSLAAPSTGSGVWYSGDAGSTWSDISGTLPDVPVNVIRYVYGSQDAVYIGTELGVFYRDAAMSDWTAFQTGLPIMPVMDLNILYRSRRIRVATFGRGVWESDWLAPSAGLPIVQFSLSDSIICVGDSIQFQDQSSGNPQQWTWFFPGGIPQTSQLSNPQVSYQQEGSYTVILRAENAQGESAMVRTALVRVGKSPQVLPSYSGAVCEGAQFQLLHANLQGASFFWQGPAGFSSTLQQPIIPNASSSLAGSYSLGITVPGCSPVFNTLIVSVLPTPLMPLAVSNSGPVCAGQSLQLSAQLPAGVTARWAGPQGFASTNVSPLLNNPQVNNSGLYSVFASSMGCESAPDTTRVLVHPIPAKPLITANGNLLSSSYSSGNQWFLNATPIPGEVNPTIDAGIFGIGAYTLQVTSDAGCSSFFSDIYTITILALESDFQQSGITIFPNPANTHIFLQVNGISSLDIEAEVLDIQGRRIKTLELKRGNLATVSVEDIPDGLYFVRVESATGFIHYVPCRIIH